MAYQSSHTGPEVDAAVEMLSQIQDARDATAEDRAEVQVDAQEVHTNAVLVAAQTETVNNQAATVQALATEVEQAHFDTVTVAATAVQARDIAVSSASTAQASQISATASAQATAADAQQAADAADIVIALAPQVSEDAANASESADAAAASAASAAAVVTGGTATLTPAPGKIPLADGNGKIADEWLGASIGRSADVQAAASAAALATSRTLPFLAPAASSPSTRFDGSPIQVGDRYFNTTAQGEYLFTDVGWVLNDATAAVDLVQDQVSTLDSRVEEIEAEIASGGSAAALATDLADEGDPTKGASLIGYEGATVADSLAGAKVFPSYAQVRSYSGNSSFARVSRPGISGNFRIDASDTTSAEIEGIILIDALDRRWKRDFQGAIQASWFGYVGAEIGAALNAACMYAGTNVGGGIVEIGSGSFTTSVEIKVPSYVTLRGKGAEVTVIKAVNALPVNQNVITNSKNNRLSRTDYNEFIYVEDMTIDGNWQGRDPTGVGVLDDQGCGVNYSTVRNGAMRRIKAINCPLHCLDVMASVYLNDGNINNQPAGPSLDIVIEDCIAIDPQRDDGITTHNSGRIQIMRCQSFFNGTPGDTQQGVEIDEGSWNVTVADCYAKNFQKGFQVKGHDTTIPAVNVRIVRCTAEDCTYSFEASHLQVGTVLPAGQIYWARNVAFEDCVSINVKGSTVYAQAKDLSLSGYIGLTVKNLTVYGTAGIVTVDKGADQVHIKGVKFKDGSILTGVGNGRIYIYAPSPALPNGQTVTIEDVVCEAPMACPVIRGTSSACRKRIKNITAYGSDATVPMIALNIGSNDAIGELYHIGYLCALQPTGNTAYLFDNTMKLEPGLKYSFAGSAAPEGVVTAPVASMYACTGNGNIYRKSTAASPFNTGWVAM